MSGATLSFENIRQLHDLLRQFDTAAEWLVRLGLQDAGWIRDARNSIEHLHLSTPPAGPVKEVWAVFKEALCFRHEASDLIRIHEMFQGPGDEEVLREKFAKHTRNITGSLLDTPQDDMGRDLIAELSYGALLRHAGHATDHSCGTDILLRFPLLAGQQQVFAIEVKRAKSEKQIGAKVAHGAEQIEKAMRGEPDFAHPYGTLEGGAVVLICDRLIDDTHDVPLAPPMDERDALPYLSARIDAFRQANLTRLDAGRGRTHVFGVNLLWKPMLLTRRPDGSPIWSEVNQRRWHPYDRVGTWDPEGAARFAHLHSAMRNALIWTPPV